MTMESVKIRTRSREGIQIEGVQLYAVGAEQKVSKAEEAKAAEEKREPSRFYYQLTLAHSEDGTGLRHYWFCDEDHAQTVAAALKQAQAPVLVAVDFVIGRRDTIGVESVKVEG
jgi:hypothetical protein